MIERASLPNWQALSRRRAGDARSGRRRGRARGRHPATGGGGAQARRHAGQCATRADRDPRFHRSRNAGPRRGTQCEPDHRLEPAALRPVRADRSGGLYRENLDHRHAAPLCGLAPDQRPGAGHRPRHPIGRPAQSRVPAVGRVRRPAAARRAIQHHRRQLAPHRSHHLGRGLRADHGRSRLFRQPHRLR